MDRAALLAYASRDWEALARSKAEYWREWKERHGAAGGVRMADDLRRQVVAQRPDWPTHADDLADLQCHVRVAESLRRVSSRRG